MLSLIAVLKYSVFLLFSSVVALCFYFILRIRCSHLKYSGFPGPRRSSFFWGNLKQIQDLRKSVPFSELLGKWSKEYGPLYVVFVMHHSFLVCSEKATIKEVLTRSKYLKEYTQMKSLHAIYGQRALGRGLFTETDHEAWTKRRAIYNHAFHRTYLMGLMDQFNEASDRLCTHLAQYADGKTELTMTEEFGRTTLHVISKVGFGLDEDIIENNESHMAKLLPIALEGIQKSFAFPLFKYSIWPKDLRFKSKTRAATREIRELGRACIEARWGAMQRGEDVPPDILTHILRAANTLDGSEGFGIEEMLDDFMTFYLAGQETTSNLLSFALLFLGQNPDVLTRLRKEVDSVLDGKNALEYSDVANLQYMTLVLKESLRLRPPVGTFTRVAPEGTVLSGFKIPKGASLKIPVWALHHSEEFFQNAEVFDPDRFTRDEDQPLFAFFPFSMGGRSCIGQAFAMIEAKVILAKLLHRYDFTLVPGQSMAVLNQMTLKPKGGCKIYITARETI